MTQKWDSLFEQKWRKLGYDVGHAIGAVVINVVMFIFSDGIGNLLTKLGNLLGETSKIGKSITAIGRVIAPVEKVIGEVLETGVKLIPGLQRILEPLFKPLTELSRCCGGSSECRRSARRRLCSRREPVVARSTGLTAESRREAVDLVLGHESASGPGSARNQ